MRKRAIAMSAAVIAGMGLVLPTSVEAAPKAVHYLSHTRTVATPADSSATGGVAKCPAGWAVLSGGYSGLPVSTSTENSVETYTVTASYPASATTWRVSATLWKGERNPDTGHWMYKGFPYYPKVYARCVK